MGQRTGWAHRPHRRARHRQLAAELVEAGRPAGRPGGAPVGGHLQLVVVSRRHRRQVGEHRDGVPGRGQVRDRPPSNERAGQGHRLELPVGDPGAQQRLGLAALSRAARPAHGPHRAAFHGEALHVTGHVDASPGAPSGVGHPQIRAEEPARLVVGERDLADTAAGRGRIAPEQRHRQVQPPPGRAAVPEPVGHGPARRHSAAVLAEHPPPAWPTPRSPTRARRRRLGRAGVARWSGRRTVPCPVPQCSHHPVMVTVGWSRARWQAESVGRGIRPPPGRRRVAARRAPPSWAQLGCRSAPVGSSSSCRCRRHAAVRARGRGRRPRRPPRRRPSRAA